VTSELTGQGRSDDVGGRNFVRESVEARGMSMSIRSIIIGAKTGLCAALLVAASTPAFARLSAHMEVSGGESSGGRVTAGRPADLSLHFFDPASSDPLHHFHPMHGKPLHLIVVRDDLSTFAHLHPTPMGEHHPMFDQMLNADSADPDNFDAVRAVPTAGRYLVFAEAMPMGYSMTTVTGELEATGTPAPRQPFVLDPVDQDGFLYKDAGDYRMRLHIETYPECGTFSVMLRIFLQKRVDGRLEPVDDVETWLEAFGHAILISTDGETADAKVFSHLHAVWPLPDDPAGPRGPDLELTSDNHMPMRAGDYRLWIQLKHAGAVMTVPFGVHLVEPPPTARARRCAR
jgi:hypothetical protein